MSREIARPVPDKLSIWPVEGGRFGIDATFTGATGFARAHVHEDLLSTEGVLYQLRQELDSSWTLRLGPLPAAAVSAAIDAFIGGGL